MTEDIGHETGAAVVRQLMQDLGETEVILTPEGGMPAHVSPDNMPVLLSIASGRKLVDASDMIDKRRDRPQRRRGTFTAQSLDSLIEWANRNKSPHSALFLDRADTAPALTCIANYHPAGAAEPGNEPAAFCDHRATYPFPLSRQWVAWTSRDGDTMTVPDFGEWLEDHAADLLDPTPALCGTGEPETNWERAALEVAAKLRGKFADSTRMLELGRDFAVFTDTGAAIKYDRASGQHRLEQSEEHRGKDGKPLSLPNMFLIRVPVFERGDQWPIVMRFLYRARGPALLYQMNDPERVLELAIDEAAAAAAKATELPLFEGLPEHA